MKLDSDVPSTIEFTCNICGTANSIPTASFHRELAQCVKCGATPRFRGVIRTLALGLGIDSCLPLSVWPRMKHVRGLGMSDWEGYSGLLGDKFEYINTFYDRPPYLDIQSPSLDHQSCYHFVISTDVFEHVLPPMQRAFDNVRNLLKPGGRLIFSVPYTREPETLEHFEDLHEFEVVDFRRSKILINRDAGGKLSAYENLVFHGGLGATLEMRLFCERDILDRLAKAGLEDIVVYDRPDLSVGYYWPPLPRADANAPFYAYIIGARRP